MFFGLMNNLSARILTDAKCGGKHLTYFPFRAGLEPGGFFLEDLTLDSL